MSLDAQISAESLDQLLSLVDGHADAWVEEVVDHVGQVGLVIPVTQSNGARPYTRAPPRSDSNPLSSPEAAGNKTTEWDCMGRYIAIHRRKLPEWCWASEAVFGAGPEHRSVWSWCWRPWWPLQLGCEDGEA